MIVIDPMIMVGVEAFVYDNNSMQYDFSSHIFDTQFYYFDQNLSHVNLYSFGHC